MSKIQCPFCFRLFAHGGWWFRCQTENPATCPREPDKSLAAFRRLPTLMEARTFAQPSRWNVLLRKRKGVCTTCKEDTYKIICPECHNPLPNDIGEFPTFTFGLVGARESGKSQYIGVIIDALKRDVGGRLNCSLQALNDETTTRYANEFEMPLFRDRRVIDATISARSDHLHKSPLLYCLTMLGDRSARRRQRVISLTFFDTAGEDLMQEDVMDTDIRYLSHSHGLILLVDPLQIDHVRSQIQDTSILPDERTDPSEIIGRMCNVIRKHRRISRSKQIEIPLAIAFSKIDAVEGMLSRGSTILREANHDGAFDHDDVQQVHAELEGLLETWLGPGFNQLVKANFKHFCYLGLSALGCPPQVGGRLARAVNPHRIEDPLLWLMWRNNLIAARKGER